MTSMYKPNISTTEKWVSTIAGTALAIAGYQRSNKTLGLTGLGLVARGVTGFCPVNAAVGRNSAFQDTRKALGGPNGVRVEASTVIYRPMPEVYAYWRQFENLPLFMSHLLEVQGLGGGRSRWTATGPLGVPVSWDAEIIKDLPPRLISWRSLEGSDVVSAGSVRFRPAGGDRGTEVRVKLQYDPPAGRVGAALAWLIGEDPLTQIEDDLCRFKQLLETGEVSAREQYGSSPNERLRQHHESFI
jgi:uncharacterized membrane protein